MPKIKDKKDIQGFKTLLGSVLVKISVLSGIKTQIDDFVKQDILKMILNHFKELSIEELYKAFELERYGEYDVKTDHFQLFDANYISEILKKFKKWKTKEQIILGISNSKYTEKEITETEKIKLRDDLLKVVYEEIKEKGFSSDAWHIYSDLKKLKRINPTDDEKKKLYKEQLRIYEIEEKAIIRSKRSITLSKPYLIDLANKISSKNPVESVSNKCKSIIVSKYMIKYINSFEDFKNQIIIKK